MSLAEPTDMSKALLKENLVEYSEQLLAAHSCKLASQESSNNPVF